VTKVFSRWFGRKTRTGRPDFSAAETADFKAAFAVFLAEDGEGFRRGRAEREAVCRAFGRGFFFINAEDSEPLLEGTIILRARRGSSIFP
jgi:hypothetical protein